MDENLTRFRLLAEPHQGMASAAMLTAGGFDRSQRWRAVRAGRLRLVAPRVYAEQPLPPLGRWLVTDEGVDAAYVARVRTALLSHGGARLVAAGRTAAVLRGWGLLVEPRRTLELAAPHGRGSLTHTGLVVRQHRQWSVEQVSSLPGAEPVPVTDALSTVLHCAWTLPRTEAITVLDSAMRSEQVTQQEVTDALRSQPGRREAERARRVVRGCDPSSGSVLESAARCLFVDAGLTGFTTQYVAREVPELRVDFCWADARLIVEVDGERWHRRPARDQRRDNWLAVHGWRVVRLTWDDIMRRPEQVLRLVGQALQTSAPAGLTG